ncbi:MAG: electron transporter RnfD [Lachnospiraceae bacterium]|nr:electron transporter RnfD [Lachnospiraceae bacterium]
MGCVPLYGKNVDYERGVKEALSEQFVSPVEQKLQYMGRIDFDNPKEPVFVFASTYVKLRFKGTTCYAKLRSHINYWSCYMGVFVDGVQKKFRLPENDEVMVCLAKDLEDSEHEVMLFKRQDACNHVDFLGFYIDKKGEILENEPLPERKIEVYGDSVSAGEVSEAVEYVGEQDPKHDGAPSNSWYSYSWMAARKLNAQIHNISQGGLALLDGTGWFCGPDFKGAFSLYDRIEHNVYLGRIKKWDFKNYIPDVVVIALGQNDANPVDFMAEDPEGEMAQYWKDSYKYFVGLLRKQYGAETHFIFTTTILGHDPSWDNAIGEICAELGGKEKNYHHFMYTNNGCGTKGHIRVPEADAMSDELSAFIETNCY